MATKITNLSQVPIALPSPLCGFLAAGAAAIVPYSKDVLIEELPGINTVLKLAGVAGATGSTGHSNLFLE